MTVLGLSPGSNGLQMTPTSNGQLLGSMKPLLNLPGSDRERGVDLQVRETPCFAVSAGS